MLSPERSPSMEAAADSSIRKRVCKACDRCRLKKSKCDGSSPCSRCKADNAICVFGERKKSHDKVYPKGYVEMLEQQQTQLVSGLRELYRILQSGEGWPGSPLQDQQGGHPLTHDILERLGLLHPTGDAAVHFEGFEEDTTRMQQRLMDEIPAPLKIEHIRAPSVSSESDHGHSSSPSSNGTPQTPTKPFQFTNPFPGDGFQQTSPLISSFGQPQQQQLPPHVNAPQPIASPFQQQKFPSFPEDILRSQWALETPVLDDRPWGGYASEIFAPYDPMAVDAMPNAGMFSTDWMNPLAPGSVNPRQLSME
ncbi:hypothetical protein K490DRAFT_66802 [Saccharata proteae CBS 121410]|uniref:Zn(2)-C6 fungal-type domain-containing protein n=1 Tax=Saccharata proteae CBS 121410 TaxID=1314787 RepID=A0A9P4HUH9_9PEZI|nr:hypothetical protein K490DRAFT_66802 [Saccharata proteae CBS 121410]